MRITAQLIDVTTDTHLWAETYRGKVDDIFDIQENVSKKIVEALRLTLTPAEEIALGKRATSDTEALDFNLHARELLYRLTKSALLASIDLFEHAIELDPRYAAAHAGMAEANIILYQWFDKTPDLLEQAQQSSLKALMYDSTSSEAYSALALVYYNKNMLEDALNSSQKAIELEEDNFFAKVLG